MRTKILITNAQETFGFAINMETGDDVYIPASITKNFDIKTGETYEAKLDVNTGSRAERTPWFCHFIFTEQAPEPQPQPQPQPEPEPETEQAMCDYIFDVLCYEGAHSTSEISKRLRNNFKTATMYTARELLVKLFADNRIVKADIHRSPNQQRASLTLWGHCLEDIIGDDHDTSIDAQ